MFSLKPHHSQDTKFEGKCKGTFGKKPQNSAVFHRFIAELDPLDRTPHYLFLGIKKVLPQTRKDPANLGVNRVFSVFMSARQSLSHQEVRNHPASGIHYFVIPLSSIFSEQEILFRYRLMAPHARIFFFLDSLFLIFHFKKLRFIIVILE